MTFLPEQVWFLGQGRYFFFIKHNERYASLFINREDRESIPIITYYTDELDKNAEIMLLESTPGACELYNNDFRITWNFEDNKISVLGRTTEETHQQ